MTNSGFSWKMERQWGFKQETSWWCNAIFNEGTIGYDMICEYIGYEHIYVIWSCLNIRFNYPRTANGNGNMITIIDN